MVLDATAFIGEIQKNHVLVEVAGEAAQRQRLRMANHTHY